MRAKGRSMCSITWRPQEEWYDLLLILVWLWTDRSVGRKEQRQRSQQGTIEVLWWEMWRSWHPKTKRKQLVPGEATFLMIVLWEATSYLKRKKARKEERESRKEGGRE